MARLIDADKQADFLKEQKVKETGAFSKGINKGINIALSAICNHEIAPTVDTVEVKSKVGDYVYALWEAPVKLKYIIYCAEVKEIRISMRNCRLTTTYILEPIDYRGRRREYRAEEFGTLVFTDKEDAERKLYPCEHCISGTYRSCEGCSYGERRNNEAD